VGAPREVVFFPCPKASLPLWSPEVSTPKSHSLTGPWAPSLYGPHLVGAPCKVTFFLTQRLVALLLWCVGPMRQALPCGGLSTPPFSAGPQCLRCCNGGFISPASRLDTARASAMASAVPTTGSTPLHPAACVSMCEGSISLPSMSTFTMCHQAQQGQHIQETQVCWPLLTTLPIL